MANKADGKKVELSLKQLEEKFDKQTMFQTQQNLSVEATMEELKEMMRGISKQLAGRAVAIQKQARGS